MICTEVWSPLIESSHGPRIKKWPQKITLKHFKTMLWLFWIYMIYGLFMENKLGHVVFLKIYRCCGIPMGYLLSNQKTTGFWDLQGPPPTSATGGVAGCFGTGTVGGSGGAPTVSTCAGGAERAELLWKFLEKPSGLTLWRLICCWFHRPWNAWRGQPDDFFPVCSSISNLQWCFSMFQFGFRSKTILNLVKMGLWIVL